eukprot:CAMPEP_0203856682 /NCGR_PEP_ID=MMETSP0359-20131031/10315_1 /ASSEMBLY_ACC=CAM_ASM_000338 /TAXON_ID=268821 /ORGANISM="Scrippsiella Hangoei, Strain SHTV-5" /LENGTH=1434 /DNA_ID=CAMNT_0050773321 /DNA_START=31 /DNA_END=4335 /DNA_ORIENTATION=+
MAQARELNVQLLPIGDLENGQAAASPVLDETPSELGPAPSDCRSRGLYFTWVFPLLRRASDSSTGRLEVSDLFALPADGLPQPIYEAFIQEWQRRLSAAPRPAAASGDARSEGQRAAPSGQKPGRLLLRVIWQLHWPSMRILWLGRVVQSLLGFNIPIAINLITKFVQKEEGSTFEGLLIAVLLLLAQALYIVVDNHCSLGFQSMGLRIRSSMILAIFRKVIVLRQDALLNFSTGKLNNMITTDVDKARKVVRYMHLLVVAPMTVVISLFSLYRLVGVSVFIGLAWMGIVILLNPIMMHFSSKLEDRQQSKTDERVRQATEVISAVHVIKCYGWEEPANAKVEAARTAELRSMWYLYCMFTAFEALWSSVIPITTAVMFASYSLLNPETPLDPATAFTAMALLGMVQDPLFTIPWVLNLIIEALVAAKRLERLFFLAEAQLPSTAAIGSFCRPERPEEAADAEGEGAETMDARAVIDFRGESFQWPIRRPRRRGSSGEGEEQDEHEDGDQGEDDADGGEDEDGDSVETGSTSGGGPTAFCLSNLQLRVKQGALVAVVGATASGKTSLLQALLGEMPQAADVGAGGAGGGPRRDPVRRSKPIAFAPQQPWVFNASIRQNILFGQPFVEQKYNECISCCDLDKDLALLKDGDLTRVGEKGIALSGGQKARVCLARAVYRKDSSNIFLLDDPYSALDAHVARKVHDEAVLGVLARKTRVVATNRLEFAAGCDLVLVLVDGRIDACGPYEEVARSNDAFRNLLSAQGVELEVKPAVGDLAPPPQFSRAISANSAASAEEEEAASQLQRAISREGSIGADDEEARASGQLKKEVFFYYLRKMGRPVSITLLASLYIISELIQLALPVWVAFWTSSSPTSAELPQFLAVYVVLSVFSVVFMTFRDLVGNIYGFRAARRLHVAMLQAVLRAPLSFFQDTPHGRIINRFSKDMSEIDKDLVWSMVYTFVPVLSCVGNLALVAGTAFFGLLAFLPAFYFYYKCWKVYNPAVLDIKRISKVTSSPVYDHFNNLTRENAVSIVRAHQQVERECARNAKLVADQQRPEYSMLYVEQWFCVCVENLGILLVFAVACFSVLGRGHLVTPGTAALSLSFAIQFSSEIQNLIGQIAEFGMAFNCVERVMEYATTLPEEAAMITDRRPPEHWPEAGVLEVQNLNIRYRPGLPLVLKGLSFSTRAGERVGVVGRTGAGKSTLLLAILRIVEPEPGSQLRLDGEDLLALGLKDLRSNIAMIPQEPVLFQDSLRYNCDPFSRHSSEEVWRALEDSQLAPWVLTQRSGGGGGSSGGIGEEARGELLHTEVLRLPLPSNVEDLLCLEIKEGGQNLSAGQRQMVAIARAVLRSSKLVVLDEATAALDSATDAAVQLAVRRCFKGATTLTIAHRLQTIMDSDSVLVLRGGELAERGTPSELRAREGGIFRGMVEEARL